MILLIYSKSFDINSMFVVKRMKVTTGKDERGPLLKQGFIDQISSRKNEITHKTEFAGESRVGWETATEKRGTIPLTKLTSVSLRTVVHSGIAWYEENDTRSVAWYNNGIRDSKMDYSSSDYITNFPMRVYLYAESYSDASKNTGYMAVDYAFVRKFVESEPAVSFASGQIETESSAKDNTSETDNVSEPKTHSNQALLPKNETVLPEVSDTEEAQEKQ